MCIFQDSALRDTNVEKDILKMHMLVEISFCFLQLQDKQVGGVNCSCCEDATNRILL